MYLSDVVGEVDGSVEVMRGEGIAKTSAKGASHHYRQTPPEDPTELHEIKLRVPLPRGSDAHLKRLDLAIAADPEVCAGRNSRLSRHGDKVKFGAAVAPGFVELSMLDTLTAQSR